MLPKINKERIRSILLQVFINKNCIPSSLHIIFWLIEVILYSAVALELPMPFQTMSSSTMVLPTIIALFILFICLRVTRRLSIIKVFYIIIESISFAYRRTNVFLSLVLILVLLIIILIDILSNTSFQFIESNITAQNYNIAKTIQYLTFITGIAMHTAYDNRIMVDGIMLGLFVGLFLFKRASLSYSVQYKELQLRSYVWIIFLYLCKNVVFYLKLPIIVTVCTSLVLSQLVYAFYKAKSVVVKTDELLSRQQLVKLAYKILIYLAGKSYSKSMQEQIKALVWKQQKVNLSKKQKYNMICNKLIEILINQPSLKAQLIVAQLYITNFQNILKAKLILQRLKRKLKWVDFNEKILIYRLQEMILQLYHGENEKIKFAQYESYELCNKFRELLLKSSLTFLVWLQYMRKDEIQTEKLRLVAQKVTDYEERIVQSFKDIPTKCITLKLLYVTYLFQVARDIRKAKSILEDITFNEEFQINLKIDQKVFLKLGLQQEPLKIIKVGQNVSNLLGYQRRQIQGQKHSIFLPQFYQKQHKDVVNNYLQHNFSNLYLFERHTIIKAKEGHYELCNLVFRLYYEITNEIILQGYIQIINNQAYNRFYYLFVNADQEIIDCADNLQNMAPTKTKFHRISEFFQPRTNLNEALVQHHIGHQIRYQPLVKFNNNGQSIIYYIREQSYMQSSPHLNSTFNNKVVAILPYMFSNKIQFTFIRDYYQQMILVISKIRSTAYTIIISAIAGSLIILFTCASIFIVFHHSETRESRDIMVKTQNLIRLYDNVISLGLQTSYIDLQQNYNYNNTYVNYNPISLILTLQTLNHQLKFLSRTIYEVQSDFPGVIYRKKLYDMIMQLLTLSYSYQQMPNDPFIRRQMRNELRELTIYLFADNLNEYRTNWQLDAQQIDYHYFELYLSVTMVVVFVLQCIGIWYLQWKMRVDEKETLSLTLGVRSEQQYISSTKLFIAKITRQDISSFNYEQNQLNSKTNYNKDSFFLDGNNATQQRDPTKSQMSLKQISGRDLLGGESLNRSDYLQSVQTGRNQNNSSFMPNTNTNKKQQPIEQHSIQLKLSSIKKPVIIIPLVLIVFIFGLCFGNQIKNNMLFKLNEKTSINNLFKLLDPIRQHSSFVICFLNILNLESFRPFNMTKYDNFFKAVSSNSPGIILFKEFQFSEFQPFQARLLNLQYKYICSYLKCDPLYADQINIIYKSTIEKMQKKMLGIRNQLNNYTLQTLAKEINNGSLKYQLDLFFYTQKTIRDQVISALTVYFQCFKEYTKNRQISKGNIEGGSRLAVTIASIFVILFLNYFRINQNSLQKICRLVKTQSEINEDKLIQDYDLLRQKQVIQE